MMAWSSGGLALFLLSLAASSLAYAPLHGVKVKSVTSGESVDLGEYLGSESGAGGRSMLVLGTYAADFNAIEYAQRLRYYAPKIRECGVSKFGFVLNCEPDAAKSLADAVELDTDTVELLTDPKGEAGRVFGVERGWRPDDTEMSPFLKLFGMLWGLGAWATLPAVIGGYIGNPFFGQPWIEDALAVGQKKGRWPGNALETYDDGTVVNKFTELPLVGGWGRRPLELATLRLQNMLGISLRKWKELAPDDEALKAGVLTQLGACIVVNSITGEELYKWRDPGICAVANFEDILKELKQASGTKATAPAQEVTASSNAPSDEEGESSSEEPSMVEETEQLDLSIPYDAAARLAYDGSDKSMEYAEFKAAFESAAVADVISKSSPEESESTVESEKVDLSIPYDASAPLAYDASDKSMEYSEFKTGFEASAVADVIAKNDPASPEEHGAVVGSEEVDLSIPYDAAARLAYDASDKSMEYSEFKTAFETAAVADVVGKKK